MGKSKAPDGAAAAAAQGEANRETVRDQTYANRPDQSNQWGDITWTTEDVKDADGNVITQRWKQDQTLKGDAKDLYDTNLQMMRGKTRLGAGMMGRISDEMGAAPDWAQFGDVQGLDYDPNQVRGMAEDAAYQKQVNRLDPQYASREQDLMVKLRNRGLQEGDAAYDSAMASLGKDRNDAYEQARLGSTDIGRQEADQMYRQQMGASDYANTLRDKQIQEYISKRGFSKSEQDSLMQDQGLGDLLQMGTGA